jgi:eukaryotic-like serine/threonine-protein kinase
VLDALQTGGLCPSSWTAADGTIDPELALQPGRILGHYRIRHRLGSGTFGTVFAAWDLRLERMVALKVLKRSLFESRDAVLAEARAAARVNHPQLCTVYAVDEHDGLPVIIMEYLEGRTLAQVIADGLPRDAAQRLAVQIASGLAAAHAQGVVHGDLKPSNVMVHRDNSAIILDFGLAGQQHAWERGNGSRSETELANDPQRESAGMHDPDETLAHDAASSVATGGILGTPAYMSPEQASGRRPILASDVFAFGLMWFEMLTGRQALADKSVISLLHRLRTQDLAPSLTVEVDASDRGLLQAMLNRDASQRPTMSEVLDQLTASAPWGEIVPSVSGRKRG